MSEIGGENVYEEKLDTLLSGIIRDKTKSASRYFHPSVSECSVLIV